ncbi:GNAT family N-acetyltransferase [Subtercola endophyticus]|uniref:GNAT family N-acetyltransferase n=1 Tax=Subtercola endophyticus TaxID=2895559 RepID=UPI001E372E13|nr:GNAT family N-acetyltransferase [Subtercola endophyticus]UFS60078.1 GNAT family N-acetyltransferase [Subtercola endophyticus]
MPTDDDAAVWFQLFNDPVVMQYISGGQAQPQEWYHAFVSRQQALAAATGVCLFALVVPAVVAPAADITPASGTPAAAGAAPVSGTVPAAGATQGAAPTKDRDATPRELAMPGAGARPVAGTDYPAARAHRGAGFVGLQPWTRPWGPVGRIEIGWRLGVAFQGRGLATAGAQAALERGRAAGIDSPVALIDLRNAPSIGVATKLGMTCECEFDAPDGVRVGMWSL